MEYRDLYDNEKNLTGKTIRKGDPSPTDANILVVISFMENSKGEFLIQHASPEKNSLFTSTGGHPKAGETSLEGIITEIKEELGISIPKEELRLFYSELVGTRFLDIYYLYKDIDINNLVLQKEEVDYVKWMTIDEIKELINNGLFLKTHATMFLNLVENYNHIRGEYRK